jgi:hypothetical protein
MLRQSLQALAMDAETQRSLFPEGVCWPDELALNFDQWSRVLLGDSRKDLSSEQREAILRVDELLSAMSGPANKELWTEQAVRQDPNWNRVRDLSKIALRAFGWPIQPPEDRQ